MATVEELNIKITADTSQLKREMKGAEDSAKQLGESIKGYFAAFLGVESIKKMIELTSGAQQSQMRLAAVIRATGEAAGVSAENFGNFAERLETITLFDGEKIRDAGSILLTFKSIQGDVFESAMRSALDLSATFNNDLSSSAVLVGKALEDPIQGLTALRRVGVTFTQSQREMITGLVESGKQFEAQGKILEIIQGQVGGVAEAMGQGLPGELHRAGIAFQDLGKEMGNTLEQINAISGGALKVSDGINWLTEAVIKAAELIDYAALGYVKFQNALGIVDDALMNDVMAEALERRNKLLEENAKRLEDFQKKTAKGTGGAELETNPNGSYVPEKYVDEEKLKKSKREVESLRKELEKMNGELKVKVDTFYSSPEQQKLEQFREKLKENAEAFEKLGDAGLEMKMEIEANIVALEKLEKGGGSTFRQLERYARDSSESMARDMAKAMLSSKAGFTGLRDYAFSMLNDIAAKILELTVTRPLVDAAVGGIFGGGGIGNIFGSIFSGGGGDVFGGSASAAILPGFADGGVPPVNRPSIVGENGPEIFMPHSLGTIIPNGGGGGGTNVYVSQVFNMSPGLAETVGAAIRDAAPIIEQRARAGVFAAIERGGAESRSVGRKL